MPVDYSGPGGPTIDLAVIRRPARQGDRRVGSLVVNPGGPGGSGVQMVRDGYGTTDGLNDRLDIVSWDPRGVGRSAGLSCGTGARAFLALDPRPDRPGEQAALDAGARGLADDCASHGGPLVAHVDTETTARDLEQLRRALGEAKLTYAGYSYGTMIGLDYAERYPTRLRAMVLDGVVRPDQDLEQLLADQARSFDATITATFARCDADPGCEVKGAAATYDRVAARLERSPIPDGSGGTIGPAGLATAAIVSAYFSDQATTLLHGLALADRGDGSGLAPLLQYYERTTISEYAAYVSVVCVDSPHPVGAAEYRAFAGRLVSISPRLGASVANEVLPCAYWPVRVQSRPHRVTAAGTPTVLVVGNTGDPATPYANATSVASSLTNAVLLTLENGSGHTSAGRSTCIDWVVTSYLVDLVVPTPGRTCSPGR